MRNLGWLADASLEAQDYVLKYLVADELCACGHLDEEHNADGFCTANNTDGHDNMLDPGSFATPHFCAAYNPAQQ